MLKDTRTTIIAGDITILESKVTILSYLIIESLELYEH